MLLISLWRVCIVSFFTIIASGVLTKSNTKVSLTTAISRYSQMLRNTLISVSLLLEVIYISILN